MGKNYRSVNQIDLVPTMSLLLGLPIPYNNLGFPIDEAFGSIKELSTASQKTIDQIKNSERIPQVYQTHYLKNMIHIIQTMIHLVHPRNIFLI